MVMASSPAADGTLRKGYLSFRQDMENPFMWLDNEELVWTPYGTGLANFTAFLQASPILTAMTVEYQMQSPSYHFNFQADMGRSLILPTGGLVGFILDQSRSWDFGYLIDGSNCTVISATSRSTWSYSDIHEVDINEYDSTLVSTLFGAQFAEPDITYFRSQRGAALWVTRNDVTTVAGTTITC
jgi:hypothetical protein